MTDSLISAQQFCIKNERTKSTISDKYLVLFFCAFMLGLFIRNSTVELLFLSNSIKNVFDWGAKILILLTFIPCLPIILKRIKIDFLIWLIAFVLIVGLHYVIFPSNNVIFVETVKSFTMTILPCVICAYCIKDYKRLFNGLFKASCLISVLNIVILVLFTRGGFSGAESMGLSMTLIMPTNILLSYLFLGNKKAKASIIFLILTNSAMIMLYGSRGSILAVLTFIIFFFFTSKIKREKKLFITFSVFALILLASVFYRVILQGFITLFGHFGLSSRSLMLLLDGSFFNDNGRMDIWNSIFGLIKEKPFAIRGINADQLLETGIYHNSNTSHNIALEMWYSFGIIFGSLILIYFIYRIIRTLLEKDDDKRLIQLLYLTCFFPICLWSGSIWENAGWWVWLII